MGHSKDDVNLTSKDMEINFSNRQDDDDDGLPLGAATPNDSSAMEKDFPKSEEYQHEDSVPGVASDFKIVEKLKILEEQKGKDNKVVM